MVSRGYDYKILVILLVEWLYDNANVGKVEDLMNSFSETWDVFKILNMGFG